MAKEASAFQLVFSQRKDTVHCISLGLGPHTYAEVERQSLIKQKSGKIGFPEFAKKSLHKKCDDGCIRAYR